MSRGTRFSRGQTKLKLDHGAMGKMLKSEEMDAAVRDVAEEIAANLRSREPDARVEAPENPGAQNRSRYFVTFANSNPRERNQLLAAAFRGAK